MPASRHARSRTESHSCRLHGPRVPSARRGPRCQTVSNPGSVEASLLPQGQALSARAGRSLPRSGNQHHPRNRPKAPRLETERRASCLWQAHVHTLSVSSRSAVHARSERAVRRPSGALPSGTRHTSRTPHSDSSPQRRPCRAHAYAPRAQLACPCASFPLSLFVFPVIGSPSPLIGRGARTDDAVRLAPTSPSPRTPQPCHSHSREDHIYAWSTQAVDQPPRPRGRPLLVARVHAARRRAGPRGERSELLMK